MSEERTGPPPPPPPPPPPRGLGRIAAPALRARARDAASFRDRALAGGPAEHEPHARRAGAGAGALLDRRLFESVRSRERALRPFRGPRPGPRDRDEIHG